VVDHAIERRPTAGLLAPISAWSPDELIAAAAAATLRRLSRNGLGGMTAGTVGE